MNFNASNITQYEQFEEAYVSRLEETSKDFLEDLELVYQGEKVDSSEWFVRSWTGFHTTSRADGSGNHAIRVVQRSTTMDRGGVVSAETNRLRVCGESGHKD